MTRAEIQQLTAIHDALAGTQQDYDWATQVEVQRLTASAWLAHAEGHNDAAITSMRAAADLEERTDKHPVTPGPIVPARELLGELFMELDQPASALVEFEKVLSSSPRRFNATYGAARAAQLSGDRLRAKQRYAELLEICPQNGSARLEILNARAFLESR
jgi:tetratricopeptide (TPR) repeat protein